VWVAVLGAALVLFTVAMVPLSLLSEQPFNGAVALVIGVPCAAVGLIAARSQPRNPLGWLLAAMGGCLILSTDGEAYSTLVYRLGHQLPLGPAAVVLNQLWGPAIFLFGLVILLFPDGRLASAWWRWVLRGYVTLVTFAAATLAAATAGAMIGQPIRIDVNGGLTATDYPRGWFGAIHGPLLALAAAFWLSFAVRQAVSWRRSSGERRQQLKVLSAAIVVTLLSPAVTSFASAAGAGWNLVGGVAWFGYAALPIGIGVAILRYRLYDIDRIISRTLAYALVTGLLAGVYAGLVTLASLLVGSSALVVAVSTLVVAALFSPLRRRVQRLVDRRFNRARYDADRTVAAFAARLTSAVDLDAVGGDLAGVVQGALEPAHLSVWTTGAGQ
jgi:hypothetical protein